MKDFYEYLEVLLFLSPLLLFIVAITFRLLDNSGFLFLQKEILIDSSYVSVAILTEQMNKTADPKFKKQLERVLVYRRMHRLFIKMMLITVPAPFLTYFFLF